MSRENYLMKLTNAGNGEVIYVFVSHIQALIPGKDGTCVMLLQGSTEPLHVSQSVETIKEKAKAYNVIVELS